MQLYNPATAPPKWSNKQRGMFEYLISDYSKISLGNAKMASKVRENLKKQYKIESTKNLSQMELQAIIATLVSTIQITNPNYNFLCH
jgi:hypothetical protein